MKSSDWTEFESRKADHIRLALDSRSQSDIPTGLDQVLLWHDALPELDINQIDTKVNLTSLDCVVGSPFFVSSMTAGHGTSSQLNLRLAQACVRHQLLFAVGSQRRELKDSAAAQEWKEIRRACATSLSGRTLNCLGNVGLAQVITEPIENLQRLVDNLQARALFVHLNPLQECLQNEGTPEFAGGLKALTRLTKMLSVPVLIKETGCGISPRTFEKLRDTGVVAVDVSGLGGTHWGRIEGLRAPEKSLSSQAWKTFANWGLSTVESLRFGLDLKLPFALWASGGVRHGVDIAKLLALGAQMVGVAKLILQAVVTPPATTMQSSEKSKGQFESMNESKDMCESNGGNAFLHENLLEESLEERLKLLDFELRAAMFCTGSATVAELQDGTRCRVLSSSSQS